jgi:hypothetical protein
MVHPVQTRLAELIPELSREASLSLDTLPKDYTALAKLHFELCLEYEVLHTSVARLAMTAKPDSSELEEPLQAALFLSELLIRIYRDYLGVTTEVKQLQEHQRIFRQYLMNQAFMTPEPMNPSAKKPVKKSVLLRLPFDTVTIRKKIGQYNWVRLMLVRLKRFLTEVGLFIEKQASYYQGLLVFLNVSPNKIQSITFFLAYYGYFLQGLKFVSPIFSYLAWCYLLPRLIINMAMTIKHLIFIQEHEAKLSVWNRLSIQLYRRGAEYLNDSVTCAVGLLNCFILIGALQPAGVLLGVGLMVYDLALTVGRALVNYRQFNLSLTQYKALLSQPNASERDIIKINGYISVLEKRIVFEKKKLKTMVCVMLVLMISGVALLPFFALPLLPLITSLLIVLVTFTNKYLQHRLDQEFKTVNQTLVENKNPRPTFFTALGPSKSMSESCLNGLDKKEGSLDNNDSENFSLRGSLQ